MARSLIGLTYISALSVPCSGIDMFKEAVQKAFILYFLGIVIDLQDDDSATLLIQWCASLKAETLPNFIFFMLASKCVDSP